MDEAMKHTARDPEDPSTKLKKSRASVACTHCRSRKVRCDVVLRQPCTNCHLDGLVCLTRGRQRSGKVKARFRNLNVAPLSPSAQRGAVGQRLIDHAQLMSATSADWPEEVTYTSYNFVAVDELRRLPQEDVQFLTIKSCFSLPRQGCLDDLVQAFFSFVHPGLPVLDESQFLMTYNSKGSNSTPPLSLFVMQCLLWVSCPFVSSKVIREAGYDSIKHARSLFYQRAKLLYDLNTERCHVSLATGALLLTYRFDPDDRQGGSTWLSQAIHHARAVQSSEFDKICPGVYPRVVLKRLWWCIYMRDRILPMGLHRPMQIQPSDIDQDMEPLSEADLAGQYPVLSSVYDLAVKTRLSQIFINQCKLAAIMGDVMAVTRQQDHGTSKTGSSRSAGDSEIDLYSRITSIRQRLTAWYRLTRNAVGDPASVEHPRRAALMFANVAFMYYYATQMCLTNYELSLLESGVPAKDYTYEEKLQLIHYDLKESCLGLERIATVFVTGGIVHHLPVSTLAYLATPLLLKVLDQKCLRQSEHLSEHKNSYCAEVVEHCKPRYEGVEDLTSFINQALSMVPHEDLLEAMVPVRSLPDSPSKAQSVDAISGSAVSGWERLVLKRPRMCLRLAFSLDHAFACGELPRESQFPPSLQLRLKDETTLPSLSTGSPDVNDYLSRNKDRTPSPGSEQSAATSKPDDLSMHSWHSSASPVDHSLLFNADVNSDLAALFPLLFDRADESAGEGLWLKGNTAEGLMVWDASQNEPRDRNQSKLSPESSIAF